MMSRRPEGEVQIPLTLMRDSVGSGSDRRLRVFVDLREPGLVGESITSSSCWNYILSLDELNSVQEDPCNRDSNPRRRESEYQRGQQDSRDAETDKKRNDLQKESSKGNVDSGSRSG